MRQFGCKRKLWTTKWQLGYKRILWTTNGSLGIKEYYGQQMAAWV
jgi:hypothetical protein